MLILRTIALDKSCKECEAEFLRSDDNGDFSKTLSEYINPEFIPSPKVQDSIDVFAPKTLNLHEISINPYRTFKYFKLSAESTRLMNPPKSDERNCNPEVCIHRVLIKCNKCRFKKTFDLTGIMSADEVLEFEDICKNASNLDEPSDAE